MQADLEQKLRHLEISCRQPVSELLAGEYKSVFKGQGVEFDEVRQYQVGDDVRSMDWKVTARTGEPYIKRYVEERSLTVWLVVDVSSSIQFGRKKEAILELVALLAFTAARQNDQVGLMLFADGVEALIPPGKGRSHVMQILNQLEGHRTGERAGTDVGEALDFLGRAFRKRSIVFLFSDFQSPPFEDSMRVLRRRHDVLALTVEDRHEVTLPKAGLLALQDSESGESFVVDTSAPGVRERHAALAGKRNETLRHLFSAMHVDHLELFADDDLVEALVMFFRMRRRREFRV